MTAKKATAVPAAKTDLTIDSKTVVPSTGTYPDVKVEGEKPEDVTEIKQEVQAEGSKPEDVKQAEELISAQLELIEAQDKLKEVTDKLIEAEIAAEEMLSVIHKLEDEKANLNAKEEIPMPKGLSVREILALGGELVIKDGEAMIAKLKQIEAFALENKRPSMHFVAYQRNIAAFNASFKRMLR